MAVPRKKTFYLSNFMESKINYLNVVFSPDSQIVGDSKPINYLKTNGDKSDKTLLFRRKSIGKSTLRVKGKRVTICCNNNNKKTAQIFPVFILR